MLESSHKFMVIPVCAIVEHFCSLLIAILLDQFIGEVSFAHPLVGFGALAHRTEALFNTPATQGQDENFAHKKRVFGIIAVLFLIIPFVAAAVCIGPWLRQWSWLFDAIVLYFAIGTRSLLQHANDVSLALMSGNIEATRRNVGKIVSRDTTHMQAADAARAAIESVLENGNDAVFAPIFWFMVLGAPGAVLLRLSNTLDAMWGYKNDRYLYFGWAAARLDDALMFVPARLTALTYSICGHCKDALRCWEDQASRWYSPNAGPVMAAGAGALRVCLGGNAIYHGTLKQRVELGCGKQPDYTDINRANRLIVRSLLLWILVILCMEIFCSA